MVKIPQLSYRHDGEKEEDMNIDKELMNQALKSTSKQNVLEDKIAMELYGCSFDELDYDDKELVTWEAVDRKEGRI